MKIFRLEKSINLPITIEECWEFFSSPKNLKIITPNYMGFDIIDLEDTKMYSGQIIKYNVTPLLDINMRWVTEISHVKENSFFVDEQRFGPYSLWHHKHFIKEIENGIEMEDVIHYKIPGGIFGEFLNTLFIKNQLKEIFNYRKEKLIEIFREIK